MLLSTNRGPYRNEHTDFQHNLIGSTEQVPDAELRSLEPDSGVDQPRGSLPGWTATACKDLILDLL